MAHASFHLISASHSDIPAPRQIHSDILLRLDPLEPSARDAHQLQRANVLPWQRSGLTGPAGYVSDVEAHREAEQ